MGNPSDDKCTLHIAAQSAELIKFCDHHHHKNWLKKQQHWQDNELCIDDCRRPGAFCAVQSSEQSTTSFEPCSSLATKTDKQSKTKENCNSQHTQETTATGVIRKKPHGISLEKTPDLVRAPCPGHTLHQTGLAIWRNRQQPEACLRLLSLQLLALTWEWY